MDERLRRLGYVGTRRLLLAAGLVVLSALVLVMELRNVERTEVLATALFIPIFIAFVLWNLRGGLIAGLLAALAYIALRWPAIDAIGASRFVGLILSRVLGFLAFGAIGGVANQVLEASLQKLELYDQIDDATGLFNARFFLQDTDLELSRSKRYKTIFSIAVVDFPAAALDDLGRRQRRTAVKELGRVLGDSVRTVDRAVHANDEEKHRLAVVMPETGLEGARIFTERLRDKVAEFLAARGARLSADEVAADFVTYSEHGESKVQELRSEFEALDRREHPEPPPI